MLVLSSFDLLGEKKEFNGVFVLNLDLFFSLNRTWIFTKDFLIFHHIIYIIKCLWYLFY
jgi:hypothetical protein